MHKPYFILIELRHKMITVCAMQHVCLVIKCFVRIRFCLRKCSVMKLLYLFLTRLINAPLQH